MAQEIISIIKRERRLPVPLAQSHGEAAIGPLLQCLDDWQLADRALPQLAAFPIEIKRTRIYPAVIDTAARLFCEAEGKSNCGFEEERIVSFLVEELAHQPELSARLHAAIGDRRVRHRGHHLLEFICAARDRGAIPLLGRLAGEYHWARPLLALEAAELEELIIERLPREADDDLPLAAGLLAGEAARLPLLALLRKGCNPDAAAIGLAFLADAKDAQLFRKLKSTTYGVIAKRIYKALTSRKLKERLDALDKLGDTRFVAASLQLFCRLLLDEQVEVVDRCARLLHDYAKIAGAHQDNTYHLCFLRCAGQSLAEGRVSRQGAKHLEAVWKGIPRAPEFPAVDPSRLASAAPPAPKAGPAPGASTALSATNAELEAAIARAPDDPGGYLVYADWLQGQGNPWGELIAVQHQLSQRPEDKALRSRSSALLRDHRDQLLGPLAPYERENLELHWELGFIRSAKLTFPSAKQAEAALRALLDTPAARVLRELSLQIAGKVRGPQPRGRSGRDPYAPLVKLLVETGHPLTLRELKLGKQGAPPRVLLEAFPGLSETRDTGEAWSELAQRLAGLRLKVPFDGRRLPRLEAADGASAVAVDAQALLVGLRAELQKGQALGLVKQLRGAVTPASLDAFARGLATAWEKAREPTAHRWAFEAMGPLGADQCVDFLGERLADYSHQRAVQGVEILERIKSDFALTEIYALAAMPSRFRPRREAAWDCLERVAGARGVDVPTLVARAAPRSVPAAARKRLEATWSHWLYELMLGGDRIVDGDFTEHVLRHPLRRPLARRVLWAWYEDDRVAQTVAITADGALHDAEGNPVTPPRGSQLGVVHPVEADPPTLDRWRQRMARQGDEPLFEQLSRSVHRLEDAERSADRLTRFRQYRVGFDRIESALEARDWYVYDQNDGGGTESFGRDFARGDVTVVASLGPGNIDSVSVFKARSGWRRDRLTFDKVHPVVISELLRDLEAATGGARARAKSAPARPTGSAQAQQAPTTADGRALLPQTGRYPFAERAKSGRSKCVVCGEKIEKDTVRIGIERMIETPNFTGRATAWLHPDCRETCPELQGLADLEQRLQRNSAGSWPPS